MKKTRPISDDDVREKLSYIEKEAKLLLMKMGVVATPYYVRLTMHSLASMGAAGGMDSELFNECLEFAQGEE